MALDVTQLELSPFGMNCYVVRRPGAREAVVVDPGWPGEIVRIEEGLEGGRFAAILITHADIDHIGGVAELQRATHAPVYMAEVDSDRAQRINELYPEAGVTFEAFTPDVLLQGDEGIAELREWIANGRARYRELGGREIIGFGLFLFER